MKGFYALIISSIIMPAHAGIVIYGTRVIYPADKKEVLVQLMNQGNRSSLVQSWIDDGDSSLPPEKNSCAIYDYTSGCKGGWKLRPAVEN